MKVEFALTLATNQAVDVSASLLAAVLTQIGVFAERADLPVHTPIEVAHVRACSAMVEDHRLSLSLSLTNDFRFEYARGRVWRFSSPGDLHTIDDFSEVGNFAGRVNLDRRQAIARAQTLIEKVGYRLEQVGADLEPSEMEKPFKSGKDTIAFFSIDWLDVRGNPGVTIKLNAESGQMVGMELWSRTTWMPRTKEEVDLIQSVQEANPPTTRANPEYALALWPVMQKALDQYAQKLGLPLLVPVEKTHVQKIVFRGLARGPVAEIVMTNGWSFGFYGRSIRWYESDDCLWKRSKPPLYPSEFEGAAKLSEKQAEEIVRAAVGKLGFTERELTLRGSPFIKTKPRTDGTTRIIPRILLGWRRDNRNTSRLFVSAEVNLEKGAIASLNINGSELPLEEPAIAVPKFLPPDKFVPVEFVY